MISLKDLKSIFVVEETTANDQKTPPPTSKEQHKQQDDNTPTIKQQPITIIDPTANRQNPPPLPNNNQPEQQHNPPPPVNPANMDNNGNVDRRVFDRLMQVIESNNVEGFDYLEFKNSLKALAALPLDEATMFRSAFATASTMGLTVDKLTQSLGYYKSLLNKELQTFDEQVLRQTEERVVGKEKERQMLEKTIAEKEAQIQKLQHDIAQHQQQLGSIQSQADELKSKIAETQANFKATHAHLINLFDTDLQKINNYLK